MGPSPGARTYSRWRPTLALRFGTRAPTRSVLLLCVTALPVFAGFFDPNQSIAYPDRLESIP